MSVETQIQERLKDAMRAKDARTADCIRMIKTKHMERRTAAGFKGPLDDNLWLDVIAAYQKQLRKSREEYVAIGERGAEAVEQIDFEIGFCAQFLPKAASDDETRVDRARDPRAARRVGREAGRARRRRHHEGATRASWSRRPSSGWSKKSWARRRAEFVGAPAQSGAGSRSSGGASRGGADRPRGRARTCRGSWAMRRLSQPRRRSSRVARSGRAA